MFKKARFIFAVNGAIAELGINPQTFNSSYRGPMIEAGFNEGRTPQEVATFLACQLSAAHQPHGMELTIKAWVREGKVSREFLASLGKGHLA